jgi:hypothetical protein
MGVWALDFMVNEVLVRVEILSALGAIVVLW